MIYMSAIFMDRYLKGMDYTLDTPEGAYRGLYSGYFLDNASIKSSIYIYIGVF